MAILHLVRGRGHPLSHGRNGRSSRKLLRFTGMCLAYLGACAPEPDLRPDELLRDELGLTDRDRVHRVTLTGGARERAEPNLVSVEPGAYVEFVTADWLVHEVLFDADSLTATQWSFLERTDQVASPPLIELGSRYVLSFADAPPGRYPYAMEGNGGPGRGVIVVVASEPR